MSRTRLLALAAVVAIGAGCGGSSSKHSQGSAKPLSAEAASAAAGDIPDNQVFLTFRNRAAGYSMKYPEGWTRSGSAGDVTFRDKNNIVHVVLARGGAPTAASVTGELRALRASSPSLKAGAPRRLQLGGGPAIKATYTTVSPPNPVTGKRVTLTVDRYELGRGGRLATLDLGTPKGVDNVDAYRLISQSFRWL